jgi:hypothetical protein
MNGRSFSRDMSPRKQKRVAEDGIIAADTLTKRMEGLENLLRCSPA